MRQVRSNRDDIRRTSHIAATLCTAGFMAVANAGAQDFWQPAGRPGTGHVYELVINRHGHIFAGTGGFGVYRSMDGGASWSGINNGVPMMLTSINALAINDEDHIFLGLTTAFYDTNDGVFRSTNNGDDWRLITPGWPNLGVYSLALNSSGHIFAGTSQGLLRSMDNGESWAVVDTVAYVGTLEVNPITGAIFASSDKFGLIRSRNNGATWENVGDGIANHEPAALAFDANGHVFAGIFRLGVYRSHDGGETWTPISEGLAGTLVTTLVIDRRQNLLAGTYGQGVFRLRYNGQIWNAINAGLTNLEVRSFTLTADDFAFIGTEGGGVFRSTQPTTPVQAQNEERPVSFALGQNYPNPFNPRTTIEFSLPHASHVTLKIYNLLGEEVATLVSARLDAGQHKAAWDAGSMSAGVYVCRLQSSGSTETKKLTLMR